MDKIKVLIADDAKQEAEIVRIIVSKIENIEVIGIANNGQEEYNMIHELKPDLVITDNQMPNMNGTEVIEKIVNSNLENKPKFIVVSGDSGTEFYNKCNELGVMKVIGKMSIETLLPYVVEDCIYMQEQNIIETIKEEPKIKKGIFNKFNRNK